MFSALDNPNKMGKDEKRYEIYDWIIKLKQQQKVQTVDSFMKKKKTCSNQQFDLIKQTETCPCAKFNIILFLCINLFNHF